MTMTLAENEARRRRWMATLLKAQTLIVEGRTDEGLALMADLEAEVDEVLRGLGIDPDTVGISA